MIEAMKAIRARSRSRTQHLAVLGIIITLMGTVYPASRAQAAGADMTIDRDRLARTIMFQRRYFYQSDCAMIEGCMDRTGSRKLLRFTIAFVNVGKGTLALGNPNENPELYEWSACHGHYHMKGVARYTLLNSSGTPVVVGKKQAFCIRDTVKFTSTAGPSHGFDCENQGLTPGWCDIYPRGLDCQWMDVTGLPRGHYTLRVVVNPGRLLPESNFANNAVTVPVTIQ